MDFKDHWRIIQDKRFNTYHKIEAGLKIVNGAKPTAKYVESGIDDPSSVNWQSTADVAAHYLLPCYKKVLPVPAPASTRVLWPALAIALICSSLRSCFSILPMTARALSIRSAGSSGCGVSFAGLLCDCCARCCVVRCDCWNARDGCCTCCVCCVRCFDCFDCVDCGVRAGRVVDFAEDRVCCVGWVALSAPNTFFSILNNPMSILSTR